MASNTLKSGKYWEIGLLACICLTLRTAPTLAQLSPPGLEGARTVSWAAIGFNQQIHKRWSTTWYVGGSEQSNPNTFSPLRKGAIFVLNQETQYQFNSRWQLAIGASLRIQDLYDEEPPYSSEDPAYRKETRYYLRFFYRQQKKSTTWTYSFRPEYRSFYTPEGEPWSTPVQLRFRIKSQVNIPLNLSRTNSLIIANEILAASENKAGVQWSSLAFTEDRFSNFFRHSFKKPAVFLDVGLMHQFWKDKENDLQYTLYLSVDLLFQNPFGKQKF